MNYFYDLEEKVVSLKNLYAGLLFLIAFFMPYTIFSIPLVILAFLLFFPLTFKISALITGALLLFFSLQSFLPQQYCPTFVAPEVYYIGVVTLFILSMLCYKKLSEKLVNAASLYASISFGMVLVAAGFFHGGCIFNLFNFAICPCSQFIVYFLLPYFLISLCLLLSLKDIGTRETTDIRFTILGACMGLFLFLGLFILQSGLIPAVMGEKLEGKLYLQVAQSAFHLLAALGFILLLFLWRAQKDSYIAMKK